MPRSRRGFGCCRRKLFLGFGVLLSFVSFVHLASLHDERNTPATAATTLKQPHLLLFQYGKVGSTSLASRFRAEAKFFRDLRSLRSALGPCRSSIAYSLSLSAGFRFEHECSYCDLLPPITVTHDDAVAKLVLNCFEDDDNFVVWSVSRDLVERFPSEVWENKQGYLASWFPNATSRSALRQISVAQFVAAVNHELRCTAGHVRGDAGHDHLRAARAVVKKRECSFFGDLVSAAGITTPKHRLGGLLDRNTMRLPHSGGGGGRAPSESKVVVVKRRRGWWDWSGGSHHLLITRFEDMRDWDSWAGIVAEFIPRDLGFQPRILSESRGILRDSARVHDKDTMDPGAADFSFSFAELKASLSEALDPDVESFLKSCDTALLYAEEPP